ncbi:MAG: hypothetical protein JXQ29_04685 [Planctomycetes bacterium]|nr:hypothetical protein [Planctomycetota bacterium]
MRTVVVLASILLLAGLAAAQTMIPIPGFGSTYSASMTRGFYCQAPLDFTVVGLRVPDESNHGLQNVCLYNHTAAPPAYSGTVALTPVFSKFGEPSANIIPCAFPFKKGEWLIVIGACGNSGGLKNSYASPAGVFASNILGAPTSLYRCGIQSNIITTAPPHPVWSENNGQISRVEVYVAAATIVGSGSGAPGTTLTFLLSAVTDGGLTYQVGSSLGNGPIPIDTRKLELSVDGLLVASVSGNLPAIFQGYAGVLDAKGAGKAALNIPNLPVLKGTRIYTAFVTLSQVAPSGVASISDTFLFTIQ